MSEQHPLRDQNEMNFGETAGAVFLFEDVVSPMSAIGGGLNRSTQHFIFEGKDGVYSEGSAISSWFHCGKRRRSCGVAGREGDR